MPKWLEFEEKIGKLPRFGPAVQQLRSESTFRGRSRCEIDDSGRVLIPPTLREYAGLTKDVLWAGNGEYAELWDKKAWSHAVRDR